MTKNCISQRDGARPRVALPSASPKAILSAALSNAASQRRAKAASGRQSSLTPEAILLAQAKPARAAAGLAALRKWRVLADQDFDAIDFNIHLIVDHMLSLEVRIEQLEDGLA